MLRQLLIPGAVASLFVFGAGLCYSQQAPPTLMSYAVYATGTGCSAINISKNGYVDSFDSSQGPYAQTHASSAANIYVNGNIQLSGSAVVNGTISALNTNVGSCSNGVPGITISGTAKVGGNGSLNFIQLATPPPLPSISLVTPGAQDLTFSTNSTLAPGNYGNVTVNKGHPLALSPGTYNINSVTLSGGSVLAISQGGVVRVNVAGNNVAIPVNLGGGSISNASGIPNNLQLIYGGAGQLLLSGGSGTYREHIWYFLLQMLKRL